MTPSAARRHDREGVVDVALQLLDRVGLPDLSMRRLASELDVQPSALYWHFASKQQLLAAVADRILDRLPEAPPRSPASAPEADAAAVLRTARAIRDALLTFRDGAELVMSTIALHLGASSATRLLQEALESSAEREDPEAHVLASTAMLQFILGHTMLIQQRMHAQSIGAAVSEENGVLADESDAVFSRGVLGIAQAVRSAAPDPRS